MAQTCPGQSCHTKWSQTEFELNQTNTNSFNWLVLVLEILAKTKQLSFWFGKKWSKPNQTKLPQY